MIKLATRSFMLHDSDDDMILEVARAVIEVYNQARREIPMPCLTHVEKRVHNSDVSFVLTFDSVRIRAECGADAINYVFEVPI